MKTVSKKIIVSTVILGFFIAILTRSFSPIIVADDFSFVKVGETYQVLDESDKAILGKQVVGKAGFPFSKYSHCTIQVYGGLRDIKLIGPICETKSIFGEFSIVLNSLFWTLIIILCFFSFKKVKKYV